MNKKKKKKKSGCFGKTKNNLKDIFFVQCSICKRKINPLTELICGHSGCEGSLCMCCFTNIES